MKGKWIGSYWFVGNVSEALKNKKTPFEIEITSFYKEKIKGSVLDNVEMGGTKGVGTISGSVRKTKISFIKKMPVKTTVYPDGTRVEEQKPHKPIYYKGIINHQTNTIEGTWRFKRSLRFGIMNRKLVFYKLGKGKWEMKKMM